MQFNQCHCDQYTKQLYVGGGFYSVDSGSDLGSSRIHLSQEDKHSFGTGAAAVHALILSAGGAIESIYHGKFADGVERTQAFLLAINVLRS